MAYITKAEYDTARPDNDLSQNEFDLLADAASAIIDRFVLSKIELLGGISVFSAFTQNRIKKATISQVDTLEEQGGLDALTGNSSATAGSVTIGRYSELGGGSNMKGSGKQIQLVDGLPVSPFINIYLQPTNLLNRALNRHYTLEDFN